MPEPQPMVRMSGIRKEFPGVLALDDVAFRMYPGEVHALMGENGAGKSTLIKVLTGVYGVDAGSIELNGDDVAFSGPGEAQQAGISTVYQEVNLCPNLSVAENVCLGRQPRPRRAPPGPDHPGGGDLRPRAGPRPLRPHPGGPDAAAGRGTPGKAGRPRGRLGRAVHLLHRGAAAGRDRPRARRRRPGARP